MSTYAAHMSERQMPSLLFGSPGDWHDWWRDYYADFLEILHAACPPDGAEIWVETHIETHKLRRWHD